MAKKTSKGKVKGRVTPLMKQYFQLKGAHPDALLLYRVGDFYETFGEDAVTASQVLGITLTARNNGGSDIELAGFPYHSLDLYLPRLVRAGYRVAICEQLEKPSKEKKIVKRGVTDVITPGIAVDDQLLDHKKNNYLAALHFGKNKLMGVAFVDVSTGEFLVSEGTAPAIEKLFQSFNPAEIIYAKNYKSDFEKIFGAHWYTYPMEDWVYTKDYTQEKLLGHFGVNNLKGFGVAELKLAQIAAGSILHYLASTEKTNLKHITKLSRLSSDEYVWMDRFTIQSLELILPSQMAGKSLLDVLDETQTAMGGRLLKKWILLPLKNIERINNRHSAVRQMLANPVSSGTLQGELKSMGDLERLVAKVPMGRINPREVIGLARSLESLIPIKELDWMAAPPSEVETEENESGPGIQGVGKAHPPVRSLRITDNLFAKGSKGGSSR